MTDQVELLGKIILCTGSEIYWGIKTYQNIKNEFILFMIFESNC